MRRKLSILSSALILAATALPSVAAAKAPPKGCTLARLAELHVTMNGASPIIEGTINGQPARFIVDTGAFFSLVTPRAAEKFKLKPVALPDGFYLQGAVGRTAVRAGKADEFGFGKSKFTKVDFLIAGDTLGEADGLLGQNILGQLDVEYDLANGVIRMFKAEGCDNAALAYWAGETPFSIVPIARTTPIEPHIVADAQVNNLPIRVMLDTGAGRSFLKLNVALRAGAALTDEEASAADAARGIGPKATDSYLLPFDSFTIGDETIHKTRLRVARSDFTGGDMLLGADFFLSHRVLVSPSQRKLYFTYNGGPVFRLDEAGWRSAQAAAQARTPAAAAAPAGLAEDASAIRRRAAASSARGDHRSALVDFDKAIALEPGDAQLYFDRARSRGASGDALGARSDLDQALRLKPDFAKALIVRGGLRLQEKALPQADADFAAALKAPSADDALGLQISALYLGADLFEKAVASVDAWIAAHPKSYEMGSALNQRCWTRALWGRELDLALADCDLALRRGSRLADVLDSRGMVRLRRGEFAKAIADFDAALKLQPKLAASLYGRGLAKAKVGDSVGGAADVRAASALEPGLIEAMTRRGITDDKVVVATLR
ncbi:retroviral-like aspartic protease family protein [Phenylobacterium sp. LjRoot219]|uniref:retroviral-like aspartic protease family protein n=1 Tax=Phenylobacterium sp. LjRoot219 TaxID=3342283 RepID=UPI003ECC8A00